MSAMSEATNRGVNCTVESCRYHCGKDCCNAPVITVRGCTANSIATASARDSANATCSTFEAIR